MAYPVDVCVSPAMMIRLLFLFLSDYASFKLRGVCCMKYTPIGILLFMYILLSLSSDNDDDDDDVRPRISPVFVCFVCVLFFPGDL